MTVFTYRPPDCPDAPLLLVFHGMRRNAEEYRDHARNLADRCRMLLMAPFSTRRGPAGGATRPEVWYATAGSHHRRPGHGTWFPA